MKNKNRILLAKGIAKVKRNLRGALLL